MARPVEDMDYLRLRIAVSDAISHGARFIVDDDDTITVRNPEHIPAGSKSLLRQRWPEAKAEILNRENEIRNAESIPCPNCGEEIGRWVGHNLWVPGGHSGWGENNWHNMGQALRRTACRHCGEPWVPEYNFQPNWSIRHWDNHE